MMTTYTRRGPGQSYLKSVLSERVNALIEHKDLNLEINPLKVYEAMVNQIYEDTGSIPDDLPKSVPAEVAAANPTVQNIVAPRLTMLMEIANSFLMTIIDSLDSVPYGIRWICKQIRSLTRVRDQPYQHFGCAYFGWHLYRESTQMRPTWPSAPSLEASSSCDSSIPR